MEYNALHYQSFVCNQATHLMRSCILFAGTATPTLAASLAHELGVPLGACECARFPDGEVAVQLHDSVRQKTVFIVQSTAPPVDEHLAVTLLDAGATAIMCGNDLIVVRLLVVLQRG